MDLIKNSILILACLFIFCLFSSAHAEEATDETNKAETVQEEYNPSVAHQILLYVPNRIFDLLDIFRVKVRVGPGFDLGAQVTEYVRLYAGGHSAVYLGLPGPRQERTFPVPIGAEAKTGGALSVLDGIIEKNTGSRLTQSEVAVETQLLLVGVQVGIDPVEFADFFTGFFMFEIRDDDV